MITQQQKDKLNEYAQIKKDIKVLEEKAELLNPEILELMQENEVEEIAIGDMGKLSMSSRRNWKYTDKVKALDEALKNQKKLEEQTGQADYTEKKYIVFKSNKEKDYE